ncbi:hypothetical protein Q5424_27455 [Conexibacter sp. JD483]|uniref:hypothetical protein n=1 Tax=unclassified Conexibacter TaxID=2627773 RepID=UPI002722BCA3|nr:MULTISPECIES: hypothetical protein [unclassified Conexibacter]MDO8184322.1 hypothetical protein [Conexibacter sp. CPCC 205706]MDO8197628.1 hypothetical protein [Conexibacter sp. CPCC 205762]MDR9372868.1 hypothetical protein [Conexibacter sp. JD483]
MSLPSRLSCGAGLAAAGAALLAAAPAAVATRATVTAKVTPQNAPPGKPLTLAVRATLAPDRPGQSMTLAEADVRFPADVTLNRRLFPVCSAATINAANGSFKRCPAGSRVGSGTFRADVPAADAFNVPGRLTLFNGGEGEVTVHAFAENPVLVSEAFETRLVRTSGRFGYRLIIQVPYRLQEIAEDWFVELRTISFSAGATTTVRGRTRGLIEAGRWSGVVPFAASFSFLRESAPVTVNGLLDWR